MMIKLAEMIKGRLLQKSQELYSKMPLLCDSVFLDRYSISLC